jgi:hypothetical protein
VFPPSVWVDRNDPTRREAITCWRPGSRHEFTLALAGALVRRGWDVDAITAYVETQGRRAIQRRGQQHLRRVKERYRNVKRRAQEPHRAAAPSRRSDAFLSQTWQAWSTW